MPYSFKTFVAGGFSHRKKNPSKERRMMKRLLEISTFTATQYFGGYFSTSLNVQVHCEFGFELKDQFENLKSKIAIRHSSPLIG